MKKQKKKQLFNPDSVLKTVLNWADSSSRSLTRLEALLTNIEQQKINDEDGSVLVIKPDTVKFNNAVQLVSNMLLVKGLMTEAKFEEKHIDLTLDYLLQVHFGINKRGRK